MTRILLLGEFSTLHLNLFHQLLQVENVKVSFFGSPNGFRNLPVNSHYPFRSSNTLLNFLIVILTPLLLLPRYIFHDIVQIAGPEHFHPVINRFMLFLICTLNRKVIYLSSGCDPILNQYLENAAPPLVSQSCRDCKLYDHNHSSVCPTTTRPAYSGNLDFILNAADLIAPMQHEYWSAYSTSKYYYKTINPLPLPWTNLSFLPTSSLPTPTRSPSICSEDVNLSSLKICHAPTRYGFKGTRIVEEYNDMINPHLMPHIDILPRLDFPSYLKRIEEYDVIKLWIWRPPRPLSS
jgi:hypothetical protein